MRRTVDVKKAVEALLYVTVQKQDMYTALKVLYFADREHLSRHGRLIYGDTYIAMQHGPVPSNAYALLQAARGDGWGPPGVDASGLFSVDGHDVTPLREPHLERLSASDRECLDSAIAEYGCLSFDELKRRSHDAAYCSADENDAIAIEEIAKSLPNGDLVVDYLRRGLD